MKFAKYQGAGNDFIIINNIKENIPEESFPALARKLCRRRFSAGADGLMAVEAPRQGGDFRMLFYNADGSAGEMCGNGARCIARFGFEEGLAGEEMSIETTAGMVKARRQSGDQYRIRLNDVTVMELGKTLKVGKALVSEQQCKQGPEPETAEQTEPKTAEECRAAEKCLAVSCAYVELGSPGIPHLTVEYPGLSQIGEAGEEALRKLGRALREHVDLPKGANVNFYEIREDGTIFEKTYERGVEDFTYACGTGTGSVAAVLMTEGRISREKPAVIEMAGGTLQVEAVFDGAGRISDLYLSGPAREVYRAEIRE